MIYANALVYAILAGIVLAILSVFFLIIKNVFLNHKHGKETRNAQGVDRLDKTD